MSANLPYLHRPGALRTALDKIRTAATPDRVTGDFVNTVLQIKGGTGGTMTPFLKKIGFVASDGAPSDLYKRFRNPASGGKAMADAIRIGYRALSQANEYFYLLSDKELQALIVQVTGAEADGQVARLVFQTIVVLKSYAAFESTEENEQSAPSPAKPLPSPTSEQTEQRQLITQHKRVGLNLSYTINLNLPATSDQAVFNAIFRSLKEHLLSDNE
jgi:hypothetical protein